MDRTTFKVLIQSIKSSEDSLEKFNTIGSCLRGAEYISSFQVAELVRLMSSDDDQLEVAKMSFNYTIDGNIYEATVGNSFRNVSTKEKFRQFIHQK